MIVLRQVLGFSYILYQSLSEMLDGSIKLGPRQYMLLYHFVIKPGTSAYEISLVRLNGKKENEYGDTKDRIRRLLKLNFLEDVTKVPNLHNAHHLKLSERGIYHIIANQGSLPYVILKSLLRNYGDHLLFRSFLYPYVDRDTLLKIGDSAIFSHIFSYLHDCCRTIQETIYVINHTYNQENGNLIQYLFSWDIPEDQDTKILRSFLKQQLRLNWISNAEIRKTEDGNSIRISYGLKSFLISLNEDKTHATLSIRGKKQLEFIVRNSNVWTFEKPTTSVEEKFPYENF